MAYKRPPKPAAKPKMDAMMANMPRGMMTNGSMPFTMYMKKRAAGVTGTGSMSPRMLRDRAARLRARAQARSQVKSDMMGMMS